MTKEQAQEATYATLRQNLLHAITQATETVKGAMGALERFTQEEQQADTSKDDEAAMLQTLLGPFADYFWGERILAAHKRGCFDNDDRYLAAGWVTCACGRATADIDRDSENMPADTELKDFGNRFDELVRRDHFFKAAQILVAIETRATNLFVEQTGYL